MRAPMPFMVAAAAALLIALTEFSQIAVIPIVLGAGMIMLANWNAKRIIGLGGFFLAVIGAALASELTDLTDVVQILQAGFLLVLPSCILLWFAIAVGSPRDEPMERGVVPYIGAAAFGATTLAIVPLVGIFFASARFSGDQGVISTIMMLAFAASAWSVALLVTRIKD